MKYYIDGYNLLFKLFKEEKVFEDQREEFINFLEVKNSKFKANFIIVFDAHHEEEEVPKHNIRNHVKIVFTSKNQTADEYIEERIFLSKNPRNIFVVSNDRRLIEHCKKLKSKTMSVEQFLSKIDEVKTDIKSTSNHFEDTEENIERLKRIFEEKMKRKEDFY
ncbi:MAG: hypothetical protein A2888_01695 [Chlamydiae bacterium RIFCSPLOWO2_01_FULL_28_7]|nr:MAG: hypothetical protein A2888_01695 [Chlamydiae bacterium RIFCSPLOWO2_01_FULL_28_7]